MFNVFCAVFLLCKLALPKINLEGAGMQKSVSKYLAIAGVLATMNVANAEKSGAFVGLEAGVSIFNLEQKLAGQIGRNYYSRGNYGSFGIGGNYGLILGYKQFFTPQLGLRYYANINYTHSLTSLNDNTRVSFYNVLNYGVNVDFLANLVSKEIEDFGSFDFGGFLGIGLGGNTYLLDDGVHIDNSLRETKEPTKINVALNVGLRANLAEKHGVELVAKVPFISSKGVDYTNANNGMEWKETRTYYTVSLRYTYSF